MKKIYHLNGFTLIETALALAVVGVLIGSVFSFTAVENKATGKQITLQRQKRLVTALSSYAQIHNELPCPAGPDTVSGDARASCSTTALRNGIVPYRTLSLRLEDVIDGWGNPFSYTVAGEAANPSVNRVHANCRSVPTWIASIIGPVLNANKASFCCQIVGLYDEIVIYTNAAHTMKIGLIQTLLTILSYGNANIIGLPLVAQLNYIAYVLISHGPNGEGAYVLGSTARNMTPANIKGISEAANADNDTNFDLITSNPIPGTGYYDDVAVWKTQEMVMSDTGNNSCARP